MFSNQKVSKNENKTERGKLSKNKIMRNEKTISLHRKSPLNCEQGDYKALSHLRSSKWNFKMPRKRSLKSHEIVCCTICYPGEQYTQNLCVEISFWNIIFFDAFRALKYSHVSLHISCYLSSDGLCFLLLLWLFSLYFFATFDIEKLLIFISIY